MPEMYHDKPELPGQAVVPVRRELPGRKSARELGGIYEASELDVKPRTFELDADGGRGL